MEMKVGLTFACMNLKKLAKIKAKWGLLKNGNPPKLSILVRSCFLQFVSYNIIVNLVIFLQYIFPFFVYIVCFTQLLNILVSSSCIISVQMIFYNIIEHKFHT